ncbi:MAG TPA: TAT-variant-translocated molybdopterin oxidoreductase, partial [Oscillatoriaceae cyanobacterium]
MSDDAPLDLDAIRARLAAERGPRYWRALEELSDEPALQKAIADEFAPGATAWHTGLSRRRFLQLMGASIALAGLTACIRRPEREIIPYVRQPEDVVPGKPLYFSSALCEGGFARGVLVESHEGRPTKIEGHPGHPASLGATDAGMQAEILTLYDPDRSQAPSRDGVESTWDHFLGELAVEQARWRTDGGRGVLVVTPPTTSPTLRAQLAAFTHKYPNARWVPYDPLDRHAVYRGTELAFGRPLEARWHFDRARIVLGFDADQLERGPQSLVCSRGWAASRAPGPAMSRCYAAESTPTLYGATADHQLPLRPEALLTLALSVAHQIGLPVPAASGPNDAWARAVAADLMAHRGTGLVLAGETASAELQALCHAMNAHLGNVGTTVTFSAPVSQPVDSFAEFGRLCDDMRAGRVQTLFLL